MAKPILYKHTKLDDNISIFAVSQVKGNYSIRIKKTRHSWALLKRL